MRELFKAVLGGMLAIGIVTLLGAMISKAESSNSPVGIKGDRLDLVEQKPGCPQIAWPFGCDWQERPRLPRRSGHKATALSAVRTRVLESIELGLK